jgi:hypothetical protein
LPGTEGSGLLAVVVSVGVVAVVATATVVAMRTDVVADQSQAD